MDKPIKLDGKWQKNVPVAEEGGPSLLVWTFNTLITMSKYSNVEIGTGSSITKVISVGISSI